MLPVSIVRVGSFPIWETIVSSTSESNSCKHCYQVGSDILTPTVSTPPHRVPVPLKQSPMSSDDGPVKLRRSNLILYVGSDNERDSRLFCFEKGNQHRIVIQVSDEIWDIL